MSAPPPKVQRLLQLAHQLGVPLEIVTEKLAILGQSGAGKTYTAMRLAELLLQAGLQVIIVDLVGCWWGLRAGVDGKRGGLPILVIGGQHGDLPLSASAGAPLARLIVERRLSVVIDASELDAGELFLFARSFAEAFFQAKKAAPSPVHVLLEEAHELLAEDPLGKEGAAVHAAWVRICKLGRNYGIGYTLVSQEPQALSKRALGQVGTMIAMRTQGEYAQRVVLGWAKTYLRAAEQEALKAELPAMATGEAFIASPFFLKTARRDHITRRETFDSSRTPEVGEVLEAPTILAPVEVQQLREQFAGLVEQLEEEDPAALKRRIKDLEAKLASKAGPSAPPPPPKEVSVWTEADRTAMATMGAGIRDQLRQVVEHVGALEACITLAGVKLDGPVAMAPPAAIRPEGEAPTAPVATTSAQERWLERLPEMPAWLLRCLLAEYPQGLTRKGLAVKSGRSIRGGSFKVAVSALKKKGLVLEDNGILTVSAELAGGRAA